MKYINLLSNQYNISEINSWIENLYAQTPHRQTSIKQYTDLYTIWVVIKPFSHMVAHTIQNLNYLGYNYNIIINDNLINCFEYMVTNTDTKYFFQIDDDFILMQNSIEYMIEAKENLPEFSSCIYRLYDLNFGLYNFHTKINAYSRYGLKLNETARFKLMLQNFYNEFQKSDIAEDYFYMLIGKNNYLNYNDWENNGRIVGYHQLFCPDVDIFSLFVKFGCRFKNKNQDYSVVFDYFSRLAKNYTSLILLLSHINNNLNLHVEENLIKDAFLNKNFINVIESYWKDTTIEDYNEIYSQLNNQNLIKIAGFLVGLQEPFDYSYKADLRVKNIFDNLNIINNEKINILFNIKDINNVSEKCLEQYKVLKKSYNKIKVCSDTPLISLCDKIDIYDLINFVDEKSLSNYIKQNNCEIIYESN